MVSVEGAQSESFEPLTENRSKNLSPENLVWKIRNENLEAATGPESESSRDARARDAKSAIPPGTERDGNGSRNSSRYE